MPPMFGIVGARMTCRKVIGKATRRNRDQRAACIKLYVPPDEQHHGQEASKDLLVGTSALWSHPLRVNDPSALAHREAFVL